MPRGPRRSFRAAATACIVVGGLLGVATAHAETRPAPDYFPLRLHEWWKYRSIQANGDQSEFTLTVVADEKQPDGSLRHVIELANPRPLIRDWYTKSPERVLLNEEEYVGGGGKIALDPPRPLLQQPLKPGAAWSWSGIARANVRVEESNEVFASEPIDTPSGKFVAMKVVTRIEQGGVRATKTSWYAPGVGLVRQATESSGVASTTDLIDYSSKPKR